MTEVITDLAAMRKVREGRRLQGSEAMFDLRLCYRPEYWQGEERLLQLPADETVRLQLGEVMEFDPADLRQDTVSQDSSK